MGLQGITGELKLSGSTPELDDFVIRVVDGRPLRCVTTALLTLLQARQITRLLKDPTPMPLRTALARLTSSDSLCHQEVSGKQKVVGFLEEMIYICLSDLPF